MKLITEKLKKISIMFWSAGLTFIGIVHLVKPQFFIHVMPPYFPNPFALVLLSGIAEIILGVAFLFPKLRYITALGIILMLIVYLPVHIYMITDNDTLRQIEPSVTLIVALLRLPLQFVFMMWVWLLRK